MLNRIGVVIGRFQVDSLHEGHLTLLDHVSVRHGKMLILLGVRPAALTQNNPLDYRTREVMLRKLYPQATVLPVSDAHSDKVWSRNVDIAIRLAFPKGAATIYGGQDNSLDVYSGKHEVRTVDTTISTDHATARREAVSHNPIDTSDFRAGVIYALHAQLPRTELTVDIAALHRSPEHGVRVLMGRKPTETQWRLPGGFVDPDDTSTLMAARREFQEETGLHIEHDLHHVGDFIIDDWRVAGQDDVTHRTVLYYGWVRELPSHAKAADDLEDVRWIPLTALSDKIVVTAHRTLIRALLAVLDADNVNYMDGDK